MRRYLTRVFRLTGRATGIQQANQGVVTSVPVNINVRKADHTWHFQRPMTLLTQAEINIVRSRVANQVEPQHSLYNGLIQDADVAQAFTPSVPSSISIDDDRDAQDINYWRHVLWDQTDPGLASALAYVYSDNTAYADKAIEILNAWGSEAPTISSVHSRHRDLIVGQGFLRLIHIADLMWNYSGWQQEDKDIFVSYMKYVDGRSTGYGRNDSISDNAILFTLALGCLIQDEKRINDMEVRVQNWYTYEDPIWSRTRKLMYHDTHEVEYFYDPSDRGATSFGYMFNEAAPVSMIARIFELFGWNILDDVAHSGGSIRGIMQQLAQWYFDFRDENWDTYPFHDPENLSTHSPNTKEFLEYLNNFMGGEFVRLQQHLDNERGTISYGWYFDPYISLNRGNIYEDAGTG